MPVEDSIDIENNNRRFPANTLLPVNQASASAGTVNCQKIPRFGKPLMEFIMTMSEPRVEQVGQGPAHGPGAGMDFVEKQPPPDVRVTAVVHIPVDELLLFLATK